MYKLRRMEVNAMSNALEVKKLVKAYGSNLVVKGISFEVGKGEGFALLGINGAGKTSTLECIEGLRKYSSGEIVVVGKIGVQLQTSSLPSHINVLETIKLFSLWNQVKIDMDLLDRFGLMKLKNKQYRELSTGQKRRLHLALALIKNPDILFLDEPTAGLDVEGRAALHEEIRILKSLGKTIVMASHDMAEVESLCDKIAIIKKGELAYIGTPEDLVIEMTNENILHIQWNTNSVINNLTLEKCVFKGMESGYSIYETENVIDSLMELMTLVKNANVEGHNIEILDIKLKHASLEQRFLELSLDGLTKEEN